MTTARAARAAATSCYFENWPLYLDDETPQLFRDETGIDFKYTDTWNDNNENFAKIQPVLSEGNDS